MKSRIIAAVMLTMVAWQSVKLRENTVIDKDYGDVVVTSSGSTWTVDPGAAVTVAGSDKVLVQDASDSDALKTATAQSIADLCGGGGIEAYGEMYFSGSVNVSVTSYTKFDAFTTGDIGEYTGVTPNITTDTIQIDEAGKYLCVAIVAGDKYTSDGHWQITLGRGASGTTFDGPEGYAEGFAGYGQSISIQSIYDLAVNDDVTIGIKVQNAGLTVFYASLQVFKLSD